MASENGATTFVAYADSRVAAREARNNSASRTSLLSLTEMLMLLQLAISLAAYVRKRTVRTTVHETESGVVVETEEGS